MGYQESWLYIEPQHKFKKLIQAYEKAEQSGYYEVAGAEPHSVIVLTLVGHVDAQHRREQPAPLDRKSVV